MSSNTVLVVGSGTIGNALASLWAQKPEWSLLGLRRSPAKLATNMQALQADYADADSMKAALAGKSPDYVVMTLTPAAFNAAAYETAYLGGVRNTLAALTRPPRRILFVSSTSVYAQCDGEWVDEHSATEPTGFSGQTMLRCESLLQNSGVPATVLRCGGIYSNSSRRLVDAVLGGRFSGVNSADGKEQAFTNRIHLNDVAGAIAHLLERDVAGESVMACYIAVDSEPCRRQEVEYWLKERLQAQGKIVADRTESVAKKSARNSANKRCRNAALVASGYTFLYPSYREGYTAVLETLAGTTKQE